MLKLQSDKTKSMATLIKELDKQVSLFIRLNAADDQGTVKCISCDEKLFWSDADCCHFKDRDNMATRFYFPNLAPGCRQCNRFDHFNHIEAWEKKLTPEMIIHLNFIAHGLQKYTRPELLEMLSHTTEMVKTLRKNKGL